MQIRINEELHELPQSALNIEALLTELGIEERRGVAIAVNKRVIPKSRWSEEEIGEGDHVEIIRATQGG